MAIETLSTFRVGDTDAVYRLDPESGRVEFTLIPVSAGLPLAERSPKDTGLTPLAEIKLRGDRNPDGFGAGRTMRHSGSTENFRYKEQKSSGNEVVTTLQDQRGYELVHHLSWRGDTPVFTVRIEFRNLSEQPVVLEMMESFALGGIGPYAGDEQFERIQLHRFRSSWSSEARHELERIASECEHRAFAPVNRLWHALTDECGKSFLNVTGNGVNHPNDYGHRIYAFAVSTLFA